MCSTDLKVDLLNKEKLTREEIISLLSEKENSFREKIFEKADQVRRLYCGNEVHLRGIIEFSNYCSQDCLYCGLRLSNSKLHRYRMSIPEIIKTAGVIASYGINTIVLQSGEDFFFTSSDITEIIKSIKEAFGCAITLSLGERNFDDYIEWKSAGVDRYLLKHETANPYLYSVYHRNQSLEDRIVHLKFLKKTGFQTGSGNLIGLPGQSIADIADDILLCKELDVDMASFSPFIPSSETPYRSIPPADVDFTLLTMAVARIVLKDVHIPATTALATLNPEGREKGLIAGANVIMPNYTPAPYRQNYKIYENKKCADENPDFCYSCLGLMISGLGRTISSGYGNSFK